MCEKGSNANELSVCTGPLRHLSLFSNLVDSLIASFLTEFLMVCDRLSCFLLVLQNYRGTREGF